MRWKKDLTKFYLTNFYYKKFIAESIFILCANKLLIKKYIKKLFNKIG